jgi:anti-anti-sigma regulatory factor
VTPQIYLATRSDNKVDELATVCLHWQQWTETLVSFDDGGISAFDSCVVVNLCQSLTEWRLLWPECVLVCRRENVGD